MRPIKLKDLINESYINSSPFSKNLNEDLKYLEQKLIEEGLWDVIKQKVGDATNKTKEILLKPLIKLVVDKIAKDDPQGFSKLQQYADASKLKDLLNHPDIKKKESEIGKEVASVKESLSEAEHDDFIQEYIDAVLDEARVLRDDPRNVKRRERYQQRRTARAGQNPAPAPKKTNPPKVDKSKPSQPKNDEPTAGQNIKQGAAQLGKGIAQGADKLGIAAIEKGGDIMAKAMGGASKGVQALAQTDAGKAVGGLIGKIYQWTKAHPKLTASAGIALLGLIGTAAAIGSGGIVPLIAGTLGAAGSGAVKGGVIGGAVGAAKDAYSQIKGGAKSFKDMDYKQMGKSALKAGGKGAAIGAAIAGGTHVAGQAIAGAGKMIGGNAAASDAAQQTAGTASDAVQAKANAADISQVTPDGRPVVDGFSRGIGSDGAFSNEYVKQATPMGNKVRELVDQFGRRGLGTTDASKAFDVLSKEGLNGHSLDQILRSAKTVGGSLRAPHNSAGSWLRHIGEMAEKNPEAAQKYINTVLGKGLAALDSAGKVVK
jgi:hypothetical protein